MSIYKKVISNADIKVVTNKFAKQATGSVMFSQNGCTLLVTVVEADINTKYDFFPMTINFMEKLSSVGKIPGNYPRREAKPSDYSTLCARLIDRPIRPMFPKNYKNELQITCTAYEISENSHPDITGINATSLCLMFCESIPFEHYIGAVSISLVNGEFITNSSAEQRKNSILELKISGTYDEVNMVEAEANEVSEKTLIDAILFGHNEIKKFIEFQMDIIKSEKIKKNDFHFEEKEEEEKLCLEIESFYADDFINAINANSKKDRKYKYAALKEEILKKYNNVEEENLSKIFGIIEKKIFRKQTLTGTRIDGRKVTDIRNIESEIDIFKTPHGTGLFTRGETQVISNLTLGVKNDALILDGIEQLLEKNFYLHYNFPPYSVGEAKRMGPPGRREIGHGALAERALSKVIPEQSEFPYTIRIVSDVLESNGSSSQATICSASLALMAAGVPIKKHVAGIAMGLIKENDDFVVLTDIQGLEDHYGDMDFKVAGTYDGICAVQMDMKISGVTKELLYKALEDAKIARLTILENMNSCIKLPKNQLAASAPKVIKLKIDISKIKDVIGKGGETINSIIEQTDVKIEILEDGNVFIYGKDIKKLDYAKKIILEKAKVFKIGEFLDAKVVKIEKFGAFVKFQKYDKEALLHISKLSDERVEKVEDIVNLDDFIKIKIVEIDPKGKIKVKLISEKNG